MNRRLERIEMQAKRRIADARRMIDSANSDLVSAYEDLETRDQKPEFASAKRLYQLGWRASVDDDDYSPTRRELIVHLGSNYFVVEKSSNEACRILKRAPYSNADLSKIEPELSNWTVMCYLQDLTEELAH